MVLFYDVRLVLVKFELHYYNGIDILKLGHLGKRFSVTTFSLFTVMSHVCRPFGKVN